MENRWGWIWLEDKLKKHKRLRKQKVMHRDDSVKQPKKERYGKSNKIKKETWSSGDREERERNTGIKHRWAKTLTLYRPSGAMETGTLLTVQKHLVVIFLHLLDGLQAIIII